MVDDDDDDATADDADDEKYLMPAGILCTSPWCLNCTNPVKTHHSDKSSVKTHHSDTSVSKRITVTKAASQ